MPSKYRLMFTDSHSNQPVIQPHLIVFSTMRIVFMCIIAEFNNNIMMTYKNVICILTQLYEMKSILMHAKRLCDDRLNRFNGAKNKRLYQVFLDLENGHESENGNEPTSKRTHYKPFPCM